MFDKMALAAMLMFAAATSEAATIQWTASLDQAQEVPAPSPVPGAAGSAFGTIDTDTGLLDWNLSFSGLSGPAIGAHFHGPGAVGVTAPVVVDIGSISGLNTPTIGFATISLAAAQQLLDGLFYINIHTTLNPSGEIRGQVAPVPLPAALPLAVLAFAALAGLAARRRRT